jgi:hypothetical protein
VEFLLDSGVQIDTPGKGLASRFAAAFAKWAQFSKAFLLVECSDGTTPLCAAALWGNDAMVTYLLDKGADVSARNEGTWGQQSYRFGRTRLEEHEPH